MLNTKRKKMKKEITITYKKKKIKIIAEVCSFWKKFSGLMFSRREKAKILLFSFNRKQIIKIHSFFVFFPFVAVWLDKRNHITDSKIVKPFSFLVYSKKPAYNLIEIPIIQKNKELIKALSVISRR